MTLRTRFAPSPTGYLHIGGVRTALFCWLYARRHGGRFLLRIEDTDRERSTAEAVDVILDAMEWLGLTWDEGPVFQSQRTERYQQVAQQLIEAGAAYHCYCTSQELDERRQAQITAGTKPRYDGRCRQATAPRDGVSPVVRFRNPDSGTVLVADDVHGSVEFDNAELDDLIIMRSDGSPTYNFTVVVDDADLEVTHVIRGDDHLNNTPRQVNIFAALGRPVPHYAHVPMILGGDGARLSKRHGSVNVLNYRDEGYLPEALLNYLVRLGWSHGDQEVFDLDELTELFDLKAVNKSAATFDPEKLLWLNQHYIMNGDSARLSLLLSEQLQKLGVDPAAGPGLQAVVDAYKERAQTMAEMAEKCRYLFEEFADYAPKAAKKHLRVVAAAPLAAVRSRLEALLDWNPDPIEESVKAVATELELGLGKVAQPIRVAVTGDAASPGIGVTLAILGRDKTLARLDRALQFVTGENK